jgi:hypothetical protein
MANITHNVTRYKVELISPKFEPVKGWIELFDGDTVVGYIYLSEYDRAYPSSIPQDRLGSNDYVVTTMPYTMMGDILDILRNESPIHIRAHVDDNTGEVTAFFGTSSSEKVGSGDESDWPWPIHPFP